MVPVELPRRRGDPLVVDADVGVFPTTAEGLAKLAPLDPHGVVTYGSQTHPADSTAGLVVTSEGRARELGRGGVVRLLGSGMARVGKAEMAKAPVPAARAGPARRRAGLRRPAYGLDADPEIFDLLTRLSR
jgi:acetyl-CoA acetyltransferase